MSLCRLQLVIRVVAIVNGNSDVLHVYFRRCTEKLILGWDLMTPISNALASLSFLRICFEDTNFFILQNRHRAPPSSHSDG